MIKSLKKLNNFNKSVVLALALGGLLAQPAFAENHKNHSNTTKTQTHKSQSQTERNKANALAFYDLAFNQHKLNQAVSQYIGETYWQHNPTVADGGQAFIDAFAPFLKENPKSRAQIKRVIAEGDLVMLHVFSQVSPEDKGEAVVDIFRFDKNGKIVEHWDVIQSMPEKTVSGRGMF